MYNYTTFLVKVRITPLINHENCEYDKPDVPAVSEYSKCKVI